MRRTIEQIEQGIAIQQDLRWCTRDPEIRELATGRIAELRMELSLARFAAKHPDIAMAARRSIEADVRRATSKGTK